MVLEQAERLEETGAGIQLSPNAARILIDLGLEDRLRPVATAPTALRVLSAASGREIVRMPLGDAEQRYSAPYWLIHRGDLQAALAAAASRQLDVTVKLGLRVEDFVTHSNGVTVSAQGSAGATEERGMALLAADGVWSRLRTASATADSPFAWETKSSTRSPSLTVTSSWREAAAASAACKSPRWINQ